MKLTQYVEKLVVLGVVLFVAGLIMSGLSQIFPVFRNGFAHLTVYLVAAILYIVYVYHNERRQHFNPHKAELEALVKAHQKQPEVWKMPDDHSVHNRKES